VSDDLAWRSRPFTAAGVLFFDATERVMLVRPTYKPGWDIPGGYVEQDESPLAACRREVREELGITPPIGRLVVVDWAPHPDEGDKVVFVFDGDELSPGDLAALHLDPAELAGVRVPHRGRGGRRPGTQARAPRGGCRPSAPGRPDFVPGARPGTGAGVTEAGAPHGAIKRRRVSLDRAE